MDVRTFVQNLFGSSRLGNIFQFFSSTISVNNLVSFSKVLFNLYYWKIFLVINLKLELIATRICVFVFIWIVYK